MRFCPTCGSRFSNDTRYCPLDGQPTQERPSEPAPSDPLIGKVLDNRYRIDRSVGEGGMGVVYLATHVTLNKRMAVKVLRHEMAKDPDVVQRFIQEAQASSAIGHPNIIDISDFGRLPDGAVYFVMEYLEGEPLTDMITGTGGIPLRDAVPIIEMIASALSAAHQRGIVHRDMKPDNVFLISRGHTRNFVKVLDFGIAKVGGASSKLTKTGMVFGTPHYMSPEQAAGQSVDARTDIYALGVIMYEMCTGKVPFDADTFMGILTKHMFEPPRPPTELGGSADLGVLEPVILKALAKKPEQRYQSMDELLADLAIVKAGGKVEGPVAVPPPSNLGPALERSMQGSARESGARGSHGKAMVVAGVILTLLGIGAIAGGVIAYQHRASRTAVATNTVTAPPPVAAPSPSPEAPPAPTPVPTTNVPIGEVPPMEPVGQVELVTTPSGAEAYVGSVLIGVTPLPFPRPTQRGDVEIELRKQGYQSQTIHVSADSGSRMEILLARASAASAPTTAASTSSGTSRPRPTTDAMVAVPVAMTEAPSPMTGGGMTGGGPAEVLDPWAE